MTPTRRLTRAALMLALLIVAGAIAVPVPGIPAPIVFQNAVVLALGVVLGPRAGTAVMAGFLGLVALGLPLLAGGRGGLAVFTGPTAGFLLGYAITPVLVGWGWQRLPGPTWLAQAVGLLLAVLLIDGLGGLGMALVGGLPWLSGLALGAAFLPLDAAKALLTALVCARVPVRGTMRSN